MDAVLLEGVVILAQSIQEAGEEAGGADGLDVGFDDLAELLGRGVGGVAQREGLHWVHVEENASEHGSHDHEHLVFGEDATRGLFGLQRKGEDVRSEMHMRQVSNTVVIGVSDDLGLILPFKLTLG